MEGIVWESVWVAVGFVIFVALVWKRVGNVLNTMLDELRLALLALHSFLVRNVTGELPQYKCPAGQAKSGSKKFKVLG